MQNSNREKLLKTVVEKEERLVLAHKALFTFAVEISGYEKDSKEYAPAYTMLVESIYKLSKKFMELAMLKASLGIVGKTWYKPL